MFKKATADKSVPAYQGHALMENRNGLVVAAEATPAATIAEREAALRMLELVVAPLPERANSNITLGTDTQYQEAEFIKALRQRKVAPHVSQYQKSKLDRMLRQVKLRGLKRVDWLYRLTIVAYNLVRMRRLLPFDAQPC
ncbi:transposase [Telmatobacter bradus]|uniref:transposase n=1 Tax=Telmatobacter bradus TaxID=474953 RepID=UPI003B434E55